MTGREAYRSWAPAGARWVDWARPVPFAAMGDRESPQPVAAHPVLGIGYLDRARENVAVVVDMPGPDSVREGIALAGIGFRPVPLFNGTNGQAGAMSLIDHRPLEHALRGGAAALARISLPPDAPPAFLLDSRRMHRHKMNPSVFDNSWDLYAQDLPSAARLLHHGIDRIVLRGERLHRDLQVILYEFQTRGIRILLADGYGPPAELAVRRPRRRRD